MFASGCKCLGTAGDSGPGVSFPRLGAMVLGVAAPPVVHPPHEHDDAVRTETGAMETGVKP